jgi:hypothetical protein
MGRGKGLRRSKVVPDVFDGLKRVVPVQVGSLGAQGEQIDSRRPHAMFVVVDSDDAPGLQQVLEMQKAGRDFDVRTRCGGLVSDDPEESPLALIDLVIPETGMALELVLRVDSYRRSLLEAIRTRRLVIIDVLSARRLQTAPTYDAIGAGLSLQVTLSDVGPLVGLLQQRVNLPMPTYRAQELELAGLDQAQVVRDFTQDAVQPAGLAIQYRDDGTPSIVIVDPDAPKLSGTRETPLAGRWQVMAGEHMAVLRLDAFAGAAPTRSWLIVAPDTRILRAAASGSHHVAVVREALSQDQDTAETQWADALTVWVENVESVRTLLVRLDLRRTS